VKTLAVILLLTTASALEAQYVEIGEGGTLMLSAPFCGA